MDDSKDLPGKLGALNEIDKRFDVVEKGLGFPPKKRYSPVSGILDFNTIVLHHEWESLAAMEEAYTRGFASPEQQAINAELNGIVESTRIELFMPLE
jgi:hypothetical protein